MKNIVSILKYNLLNKKILSINTTMIIILFLSTLLMNISKVYLAGSEVALAGIALGTKLIVSIIRTAVQLSKEEGRLLFLAPIKGVEYFSAKYIEFLIVQILFGISILVPALIFGNKESVFIAPVIVTSIIFGTILAYIIILPFMIITASYIKNVGLCIAGTIIGMILFTSLWGAIVNILSSILPYVYILINDNIEIGIISGILNLLGIIILNIFAIKLFDSKLEIN